jgi:hypothetical protein
MQGCLLFFDTQWVFIEALFATLDISFETGGQV